MPDRMTPEEAERAMREDKIRAFTIDPKTGKVDGIKSWRDHWTLYKEDNPKEK